MHQLNDPDHPVLRRLEPDETIHAISRATEGEIVVTDRRVAVSTGGRLALDIPYDRLRRVQFDIERARPATLVIVPERPSDEPQVLAIPAERYEECAEALVLIGQRLHGIEAGRQ